MKEQILSILPREHPWQNTLFCYDCLPSTNDLAKTMACDGAAEGTIILARSQTAGRGRLGRHFHAQKDKGIYLSVILRPNCPPAQIMHLTCATAVAACDGIETACGERPEIKWTNDLIFSRRKLGGILTELSVNPKTGLVDWAVIGIGINCRQTLDELPDDIRNFATSLRIQTGSDISLPLLAAKLICALSDVSGILLTNKAALMERYRRDCMTLNRQIVVVQGEKRQYGTAIGVDDNGALEVVFQDDTRGKVNSGEVSVRGLYGYA